MRNGLMRIFSTAVITAALGAGAISVPAFAAGHPRPGPTPQQLQGVTILDFLSARSVHYAGPVHFQGRNLTVNVALTNNGCTGTMSEPQFGSFGIVVLGKSEWVQPSDQFWAKLGVSDIELALFSGKWLDVGNSSLDLGPLYLLCTIRGAASQFATSKVFGAGPVTLISGKPAQVLRTSGGTEFVSLSATPELLRLIKGKDTTNYTRYGARVKITPPPDDDVVPLP